MDAKARKRERAQVVGESVQGAGAVKRAPNERAGEVALEHEASAPQDEASLKRMLSAPRSPPKDMTVPQTGQLVGFKDNGRTPLVTFSGQPGAAAIAARATVDLQATHIGSDVVLLFEGGDYQKPIVLGVLRAIDPNHLAEQPGHVELEADGKRMIVSAKEQLVLRCGKAMITLTQSGKILIEGTYVSSRSSGVYRIKGGSVQLN
jgi:hypothetical protein